ncbi:hypothetical protein C8R45DRAFT_942908 [Mycena sanguinolenta]|nr:hypothetical protein C8R45DRAFT_942908 [Mycena sanguinolenta]
MGSRDKQITAESKRTQPMTEMGITSASYLKKNQHCESQNQIEIEWVSKKLTEPGRNETSERMRFNRCRLIEYLGIEADSGSIFDDATYVIALRTRKSATRASLLPPQHSRALSSAPLCATLLDSLQKKHMSAEDTAQPLSREASRTPASRSSSRSASPPPPPPEQEQGRQSPDAESRDVEGGGGEENRRGTEGESPHQSHAPLYLKVQWYLEVLCLGHRERRDFELGSCSKSKSLKDELDTIYSSSDSTLNELTPRHATLLHGLTLAQLRHSLARSDVAVLPRDDIMYRQVLPIVACLRVVALIAAFLSSRIILGLFLQHNGFALAAQAPPPPHLGQQPLFGLPVPTSQLVHPAQMNPGSLLYTRSSDGSFHPHGPLPMVTDSNPIHTPQLSSIHPTRAAQIPLTFSEKIQAAAQTVPGAPNITRTQLETPAVADDEWSPWLDGEFEADFTWKQFADTKQLQVHGSCRVGGGDPKGDEMADYWEAGKRSTRTCQGIITCDVDICSIILRPQTTAQGIAGQLLQRCRCNGRLSHRFCGVKSTLHKWSGGVHYSNLGRHEHPRLTHVLHVSPREQAKFEEIVTAHPGTRSLGLIVGVPGIHGPGKSVADISSVYLNADRVRKERDKIKRGDTQRGDGFISDFAAFTEAHPDFVVYSQIGTVTVIWMQTPFMASQLLKLHRQTKPTREKCGSFSCAPAGRTAVEAVKGSWGPADMVS